MVNLALERRLIRGVRLAIGLAALLVYGWLTLNAAPADERVDAIVKKKLAEPKPASTDEEFLRRIYLDLTGALPTPEATAKFLADQDPRKREKLIDQLLTKEAGSLEDLLGQALKNNPDIRVAETKLHEAEAELNRARLQVMQKVVTLQHSLETRRNAIKIAEARWKQLSELHKQAAVAMTMVQEAEQELIREKAKLTALEAELPYLLGKPSARTANQLAVDRALLWLGQNQTAGNKAEWTSNQLTERELMNHFWIKFMNLPAAGAPPTSTTLADKIRKALDQPVKLDYKNKSGQEILENLLQKMEGVPYRILVKINPRETKTDLQFNDPLPLGAALEAFQDLTSNGDLRFVVREYGILVTYVGMQPEGAVLLNVFWKAAPRSDGKGKTPATPPPAPKP